MFSSLLVWAFLYPYYPIPDLKLFKIFKKGFAARQSSPQANTDSVENGPEMGF